MNTAIEEGSSESLNDLKGWTFSLSEDASPGAITSTGISFDNILGDDITPDSVTITSVITGTGTDVTSKFIIEEIGTSGIYRVKTTPGSYFYYGFNAASAEAYTFTINAKVGYPVISKNYTRTGVLSNVLPTITNKPTSTISLAEGVVDVYDFNGINGSNSAGGNSTSDLAWSVAGSSLFSITSTGLLQQLDGTAEGTFNLVVTMTEASGATDTSNVTVTYPFRRSIVFTPNIISSSDYGTTNLSGTVLATGGTYLLYAQSFSITSGQNVMTTLTVAGQSSYYAEANGIAGTVTSNFNATILPGIVYNWNLTIIKSGVNGSGSGGIYASEVP